MTYHDFTEAYAPGQDMGLLREGAHAHTHTHTHAPHAHAHGHAHAHAHTHVNGHEHGHGHGHGAAALHEMALLRKAGWPTAFAKGIAPGVGTVVRPAGRAGTTAEQDAVELRRYARRERVVRREYVPAGVDGTQVVMSGGQWTMAREVQTQVQVQVQAQAQAQAPTPIFIGTMTREAFVSKCTTYLNKEMLRNEGGCSLPTHSQGESVFFSISKPEISTEEYVQRLVNYTQCSPSVFVLMLVYLDKVGSMNSRLRITAYNLHRLLITTLMLSCKMLDDQCFSTGHYAKVGGIPTAREMNRLEMQFLRYVDFRMHVPVDQFFTQQHLLNNFW